MTLLNEHREYPGVLTAGQRARVRFEQWMPWWLAPLAGWNVQVTGFVGWEPGCLAHEGLSHYHVVRRSSESVPALTYCVPSAYLVRAGESETS